MARLSRALLAGAAGAAVFQRLTRLRRSWRSRPAAEIRRSVESRLPASLHPDTRQRITGAVVRTIKGPEPVAVEPTDPTARTLASPPSPELPSIRDEP